MTYIEPFIWGLGLLALARLVLAPLGDHFTRRHAAAAPPERHPMNTISASAPPARIRPLRVIAKAARKLGDLIAPQEHAGKGNWTTTPISRPRWGSALLPLQ